MKCCNVTPCGVLLDSSSSQMNFRGINFTQRHCTERIGSPHRQRLWSHWVCLPCSCEVRAQRRWTKVSAAFNAIGCLSDDKSSNEIQTAAIGLSISASNFSGHYYSLTSVRCRADGDPTGARIAGTHGRRRELARRHLLIISQQVVDCLGLTAGSLACVLFMFCVLYDRCSHR